MHLAYLSHPACDAFDPGEPHPERPQRIAAINDALIAKRLMELVGPVQAPEATDEQLRRAHDGDYLDMLQSREPDSGIVALDDDTWLAPGVLRAARFAAGAAVHAVDLVMGGKAERAFCATRPPGHHAEAGRAMGFCFLNNIAIAAAHALAVHGLKRVAIVDFDAHRGNGTENIFRDEKRVSIFASFQERLFPTTDAPGQPGRIHNVALAPHSDGREIRHVYHDVLLPALNAAKPQLILISAGFDGHRDDAMSDLEMSEDDYAWITEGIVAIANRHAEGRVVSTLEGGYEPAALGRSVVAHLNAMLEG